MAETPPTVGQALLFQKTGKGKAGDLIYFC